MFFRRRKSNRAVPRGTARSTQNEIQTTTDDGIEAEEEYDAWRDLTTSKTLRVLFPFFCLALAVFLLSLFSRSFAEGYSRTVGGVIRRILAFLSGFFPFSVAETLFVVGGILFAGGLLRICIEAIRKVPDAYRFERRFNRGLVGVVLICFSLYALGFAPCNRRKSLEENLGLSREEVSSAQLYDCASFLQKELDACLRSSNKIRYAPDGLSVLPYSYSELSDRLNKAYDACYDAYPFLTRIHAPVKQIALSSAMTYTHISGIYIPYTGEANININYPDYVTTFSAAHEMAHQRGISHEDEANFMAFLVLYNSDDEYFRYAALMELYEYVLDALYEADENAYFSTLYQTPRKALYEIIGFSEFFTPYSGSVTSKVTDIVNDTAIKLRGDSGGSKSYNKMVELAVAYFGF